MSHKTELVAAVQNKIRTLMSDFEYEHATQVRDLCLELYSDAPVELELAALCHDIDRSVPAWKVDTKNATTTEYEYAKGIHSATSALYILHKNIIPDITTAYTCALIMLRHEHGPLSMDTSLPFNSEIDLRKCALTLWYADKICFFKYGLESYAKRGEEALYNKMCFSLKGLPVDLVSSCIAYTPEEYKLLAERAAVITN